jgi:hypothetical protein
MSTLAVNAVTDANGGNTATINSMTPTADSLQGFRNRIINGDCRIDQRNAGASVTQQGTTQYCLDRWQLNGEATDGVFTAQQDTSAPAGFNNSLKIAVTTADASIGAAQRYLVNQAIEGFNVADLNWGTESAQTVTLSFWVRSSVTGTFGGALRNSGGGRTYPYAYTISVADTWEYKTITVAGDTSGTWLTNNSYGIGVVFSLGAGSNFLGTVNTWASADYRAPTGSTNLIATNAATWYITGVQLEVGSVATPFERRPYGAELALCQRYFYMLCNGASQTIPTGSYYSATLVATTVQLPIEMRTSPSIYQVSGTNYFGIYTNNARDDFNAFTSLVRASSRCVALDASGGGVSGTVGHSGPIEAIDAAARLGFQAEL